MASKNWVLLFAIMLQALSNEAAQKWWVYPYSHLKNCLQHSQGYSLSVYVLEFQRCLSLALSNTGCMKHSTHDVKINNQADLKQHTHYNAIGLCGKITLAVQLKDDDYALIAMQIDIHIPDHLENINASFHSFQWGLAHQSFCQSWEYFSDSYTEHCGWKPSWSVQSSSYLSVTAKGVADRCHISYQVLITFQPIDAAFNSITMGTLTHRRDYKTAVSPILFERRRETKLHQLSLKGRLGEQLLISIHVCDLSGQENGSGEAHLIIHDGPSFEVSVLLDSYLNMSPQNSPVRSTTHQALVVLTLSYISVKCYKFSIKSVRTSNITDHEIIINEGAISPDRRMTHEEKVTKYDLSRYCPSHGKGKATFCSFSFLSPHSVFSSHIAFSEYNDALPESEHCDYGAIVLFIPLNYLQPSTAHIWHGKLNQNVELLVLCKKDYIKDFQTYFGRGLMLSWYHYNIAHNNAVPVRLTIEVSFSRCMAYFNVYNQNHELILDLRGIVILSGLFYDFVEMMYNFGEAFCFVMQYNEAILKTTRRKEQNNIYVRFRNVGTKRNIAVGDKIVMYISLTPSRNLDCYQSRDLRNVTISSAKPELHRNFTMGKERIQWSQVLTSARYFRINSSAQCIQKLQIKIMRHCLFLRETSITSKRMLFINPAKYVNSKGAICKIVFISPKPGFYTASLTHDMGACNNYSIQWSITINRERRCPKECVSDELHIMKQKETRHGKTINIQNFRLNANRSVATTSMNFGETHYAFIFRPIEGLLDCQNCYLFIRNIATCHRFDVLTRYLGWHLHEIPKMSISWEGAKEFCRQQNSTLPKITSYAMDTLNAGYSDDQITFINYRTKEGVSNFWLHLAYNLSYKRYALVSRDELVSSLRK